MFVLEEVQKDFRQAVFGAAFIAAVVADIVSRFASGQLPVFRIPSYPVPDLKALPAFAVLGVAAGLLGVVYNRSLIGTLNLFAKSSSEVCCLGGGSGGSGRRAGGVVLSPGRRRRAFPRRNLLCEGGGAGLFPCGLCCALCCRWQVTRRARRAASSRPCSSWGRSLVWAWAKSRISSSRIWFPFPAIFAVVGMAAYFTAIVRAPLTGIVLIIEMTGNYAQMLPLLVACFCAYIVAEGMGELPIYENLLERDLMRGGALPDPKEPLVLELEVEPGSPFEGL